MGSIHSWRTWRMVPVLVIGATLVSTGCSKRFGTGVDDHEQRIALEPQSHVVHGVRVRGRLPRGFEVLSPDWVRRVDLVLRKVDKHKADLVSVTLGIRSCEACGDQALLKRAAAGLEATVGEAGQTPDQPGKINPVLERARLVRPGVVTFSGWGLSEQRHGVRLRVTHVYQRLAPKGTYLQCVVRLFGGLGRQWQGMRDMCAALTAEPLPPDVLGKQLSDAWAELRGETAKTRDLFCRSLESLLPPATRKACAENAWALLAPALALARKRIRSASLAVPDLPCATLPALAKRLGDDKKLREVTATCADVTFGHYARRAIEQATADVRARRDTLPKECLVANLARASAAATRYVSKLLPKIVDLCYGQLAPLVIEANQLKGGQCKPPVEEAYRGIVRYKVRSRAARRVQTMMRWKCRTIVDGASSRKADWRAIK